MTRVGVVTQARTTSTRLPGKILIPLGDRTVLEHHVRRLTAAGLDVYVATTTNDTDEPVVDLARSLGAPVHRGSEDDVLDRVDGCALVHRLDVVVRVTSDCPLIDGEVVARAVDRWLDAGDPLLYLSNVQHRSFPRGFDFEVFGAQALHDAAREAVRPAQREHVTPYLYDGSHPGVRLEDVVVEPDASDLRVTLDTEADLALIRRLVEDFGADELGHREIVDVLRAHPELVALNREVVQKPLDGG
ncbi:MAG: glycosyltransferase family protein [Nocardioidaceae bacterium]|nr:glycosyltransferase family protein [Nocardioidaceae bacterium]NUS51531.1 glycosyltransferase family protein [Nocardioidaceae bacterium]